MEIVKHLSTHVIEQMILQLDDYFTRRKINPHEDPEVFGSELLFELKSVIFFYLGNYPAETPFLRIMLKYIRPIEIDPERTLTYNNKKIALMSRI